MSSHPKKGQSEFEWGVNQIVEYLDRLGLNNLNPAGPPGVIEEVAIQLRETKESLDSRLADISASMSELILVLERIADAHTAEAALAKFRDEIASDLGLTTEGKSE